jgi:hypothetical protein
MWMAGTSGWPGQRALRAPRWLVATSGRPRGGGNGCTRAKLARLHGFRQDGMQDAVVLRGWDRRDEGKRRKRGCTRDCTEWRARWMDGWILQSTAPDRVHETMNEGPARSSTCEPAPHACLLHDPTRKVSSGQQRLGLFYRVVPSPIVHPISSQPCQPTEAAAVPGINGKVTNSNPSCMCASNPTKPSPAPAPCPALGPAPLWGRGGGLAIPAKLARDGAHGAPLGFNLTSTHTALNLPPNARAAHPSPRHVHASSQPQLALSLAPTEGSRQYWLMQDAFVAWPSRGVNEGVNSA